MASGSASFPPFFPTSSCVHCPGLSPHITSTSRLHCPTSLPHTAAATCLLSVSVSRLSRFPFFYLNVVKKGRSLSGYKKQKKTTKNKLQSCKRTNVSGSEDAHTPRRWLCNSQCQEFKQRVSAANVGIHKPFQNKKLMKQVMQKKIKKDKMLK